MAHGPSLNAEVGRSLYSHITTPHRTQQSAHAHHTFLWPIPSSLLNYTGSHARRSVKLSHARCMLHQQNPTACSRESRTGIMLLTAVGTHMGTHLQ
eukprot:4248688-Prymnesium_polylepis.1